MQSNVHSQTWIANDRTCEPYVKCVSLFSIAIPSHELAISAPGCISEEKTPKLHHHPSELGDDAAQLPGCRETTLLLQVATTTTTQVFCRSTFLCSH